MIQGILDNDLYKFTMMQAVVACYPEEVVRYRFINRGGTSFPAGFKEELERAISQLCAMDVGMNPVREGLGSMAFFSPPFLDFISQFTFDSKEVVVNQQGGDLEVFIEGFWFRTILWEVPLLAMISEIYHRMTGASFFSEAKEGGVLTERNRGKGVNFRKGGIRFADFGTRRRFSSDNQEQVILDLRQAAGDYFVGTSNVYFALKHRIKAIGTVAHEWIMFHGAKYGFQQANTRAMECWLKVYQGNLGIVLSDTYTSASFLQSFDGRYARTFDGVRHDSGDPILFGERVIAHYKELGLDDAAIRSKTMVFSDALDFGKVMKIEEAFRGRIKTFYGIGTWLTNDIPNVKPLNMVIKLDAVMVGGDWVPCVKLTDDPSKQTGDVAYLEMARRVLKV